MMFFKKVYSLLYRLTVISMFAGLWFKQLLALNDKRESINLSNHLQALITFVLNGKRESINLIYHLQALITIDNDIYTSTQS